LEQKLGSQYFFVGRPALFNTSVTTEVKKVDPLLADLKEKMDRTEPEFEVGATRVAVVVSRCTVSPLPSRIRSHIKEEA